MSCQRPLEWCLPSLPRDLRGAKRVKAMDYAEGILHRSVASPDAYGDEVISDLELPLIPFPRLRKTRGSQIQIPERVRLKAVAIIVEESRFPLFPRKRLALTLTTLTTWTMK